MSIQIYAHIVTHNSASVHSEEALQRTIDALYAQQGFVPGEQLHIHLTDNASTDSTASILREYDHRPGIRVTEQTQNLGFCGAHNAAAYAFLQSDANYFLILNPDLELASDALSQLVETLEQHEDIGSVCPRLYQVHTDAEKTIDSSGMLITPALRHFDRGQGDADSPGYARDCYVFGGSGACLLFRRSYIEDVGFRAEFDRDLFRVYPQLEEGYDQRFPLFDEAFFAYRDDAELAWRSQYLGWSCRYVAKAIGFHHRVVTPEKRATLPAAINTLGVQNRFLLQRNCYRFRDVPAAFLPGILWRNCMVVIAVLILERSSMPAFSHFFKLYRRARARSKHLMNRVPKDHRINRWFSSCAYVEAVHDTQ